MPLSLPNKDKKKKKIDEVEERLSPKKVSDLSFSEARVIREQYGSLKNYELATDKNRAKRIDEQMQDLNARRLVDAATSRGTPVEAESYGKNNKWNDYTTVMSERKSDYDRAVEKLKKDLDVYSPVADVSGVKNYLDATKAGYDNAIALGKSVADFGNAFKSADDFKRWSIGWDESRTGDKNFEDTAETRKARKDYYDELKAKRSRLEAERTAAEQELYDFHQSDAYKNANYGSDEEKENINTETGIQSRIWQYDADLEALDADIARYERFTEVQDRYAKLREDPNFERYASHSGYGIDKNGNTISTGDNVVDNYFGVSEKYKDVNVTDPTFDAMYGVSDQERNLIDFGYNYSLDELTEEEKQTYRYLLATQGADSADQFLEDMKPTLNRRAVQREANELKNASGWELAIRNIASVPQNIFGGVTAAIADVVQGDNKNPYDKWHRDAISASAVRGETAQRINNATGNANLLGFSLGDTYQALMSAADSAAGAALFGRAYTITMGAGAASSRAKELYENGASNNQILMSALASGLTEVVTEYVSVDKLVSNFLESTPKNKLDLILKMLSQGGIEASEEFAADILNTIQDNAILGSQSEWNKKLKEYMDGGMSREEAQQKVWLDTMGDALKSAAGGFVSGIAMSGGASAVRSTANSVGNAIDTRREGRYVNEAGGAEALQNLAREVAGAPNLTKAVDKVTKKASNKNVGKLSRALEQTIVNEADAETRSEKGAKYTLAREGVDLSDVKAREGTNLYNNVDVSDKISDTGATVDTETGGEVTIDERNPITQRDGKTYLNTSAGEILQDDIKYSSEKEAQLYEYVSDLPQSVANAIVENYKGQENVRGYVNGMRDGILLYGYNNIENVPKNTAFATLSGADQQYARQIGRNLAAEDLSNAKPQTVGKHVAVQETATTSGERVMNLSEIGLKATPAVAKKIGAGGTAGAVYTKGDVDLDSAIGRADGLLAYVYSSIAGNSVVLYDSKTVKDADLKNANGKHVASDGTIYLDIRAEAGNNVTGGIAYTLGHEMTHEAEQWAKKEYAAFKKFLYENYIEKGTAVEDLIAKKMSDLDTTDRAYAESEVVADACERMLLDSDAMEKLAELQDKEPGTVKKILDFIKRALEKIVGKFNSIREVYETMGAENTRIESKLVQEFGDNLQKLQDMWSDMVVTAAQNRTAAVEHEAKQTAKTTEQYSKKLSEDEYARYMELAKDPVKNEAELSQMVEAAARDAGYTSRMWHGAKDGKGFTKFKDWSYFTEDREYAEKYTDRNPDNLYGVYVKMEHPFDTRTDEKARQKFEDARGEYGMSELDDTGLPDWTDGYDIVDFIEENGLDYDGVALDEGAQFHRQAESYEDRYKHVISYVVKNSAQVKSADPVTYDDQGNIIPLEERFNEEKNDIRYSLKQNRVRTPAEIRKEMSDLATEIATLQKQYEQIENSDEYKTLYGSIVDRDLNDEQFNEAIEKYSKWEKESGFAELHQKLGDLRKKSGELNQEFSEALRNADVLEEQEKIKKSGLTESEYFRKQAVKEFGYTPYFIDAGYLLPDGKLLNFSGEKGRHFGTRGQDHRAIGTIFADSTGSSAMLRFMKDGNIRVIAEGPGVDISSVSEPTQEQYSAISRFIQDSKEKGYFSVDFTDENGTVVGKLEYEDSIAPSRVINDIKHFYQTGETRDQSTVSRFHGDDFSRKSSESYAVRDIVNRALKRLDPSSAEYRAMAKYKAELDTLDNMRAQLDEAIKSGDRQAQTRLTNNIKTQRGILNRIENSASMKNVASMRDVTRLADDAKKLREMLKLQSRETNGTIAKQRSVNAAASEIMEKYGIKRGKGELAELLGNYYTKMMQSVNNEAMTREAALDQAREAAEWIARHVPDEVQYDDGAIEALDMLRGYKVKLNDDQRQNIRAKYDDINGWRRAVGGYITLSNEGKYLDELWPEWAERAPGYFNDEMLSDADMPERLAEIIDSLKKSRETVIEVPGQYEYDLDRAANDVYEAFWNIEPEQTVADKYAERIKTLKAEHNAMMSDLRKSFRDTIREETREAYREGKQKAREYTRKIEVRRKVKKLAERLHDIYDKPKVNKYVPAELAKPTVELLKELDFETGRASKLAEKFGNLKLQYDAMMKGDEGKATYPQEISDLIEKMRTEVKGMAVKDMSADQLEDIYTTLKAFDHVLKTAREARNLSSSIGEDMTIYEAGEKWINEISETKEAKSVINKYTQQMLTPREFFERLASYKKNSISEKVFDMLNRAERKQAEIEMRSNMIFDDIMKNVKYLSQLSSTKNLVDIGLKDSDGNAVPITRGMMLAYYMHTLNEDNARHVAIGGMKAPDLKQYYKGDADSYSNGKRIPGLVGAELAAQYEKIHDTLEGKRNKDGTRSGGLNEELQDAMDRNNSERVEELLEQRNQLWAERDEIIARGMRMIDQQRQAIEEMLTDEDKAFIKATQDYFENYSKDVLNEATMQMYGFEKARVENYFPIHSDANFLKAAFETVTNDASLENKGFMKDRVKAANPIMLEDFSSVINSQIQKTAQYAAFAPILREFNKLYSVKTGGVAAVDSVMEAIDEKFGQAGTKYISNLVADMNGARRRDTTFLDRARSNFAGAVLTLNPRVSMVQAASYPSAAAVVGHKALAKALALPDNSVVFKRANQELISKYTARLWQRNQGGADVTLHDAKSVNSLYSRANRRLRFLTGWIEAVDAGTVGRLWYASEYYVRDHFKNLERGTDEYYEKTAEVFNEVVERTQPNYTTLQRPDILRNPNQLVRSLTMFMTQRLQNFNIVYSAARRYAKYSSDLKQNKNDVTREDVREARGNLTRAITSQAVATAALAGIKLLADALLHNFRRRKDEETGDITAESVLMSTVDDFIGSLFSDIVGGSEAYDIVKSIVTGGKYYEPEIGGIGTFVDTAKDAVNLSQKIMGKDNPSANDFIKLGYNLAQIFGIPAENGGKIGKALWNHVQDIKNGEFGSFNAGDAKTEKQKGVAAYRAYERGDMDTYEEISSTMKNPKDAMKYGTGSSYGKFDEAVETGEDLGGVIDEYLDMGYTEEGLAAQITRDFKQKYRNASDKASLKRKLLDAYEELGYDRDKKSKDIDKWLED